jgi:ribonuclease BN (tRNA processing enzyme)
MQIEGRRAPLKRALGQILRLVHTPKNFFGFGFSISDLMDNSETYGFKWCKGKHVPRSNAYRIDRDGSLCISGDTRPLPEIARMAEGVDLLIHDSSFTKSECDAAEKANHSTSSEAGRIAHRAGASTLLLFYLLGRGRKYEDQILLEASEQFTGEIVIGRDFMTLRV